MYINGNFQETIAGDELYNISCHFRFFSFFKKSVKNIEPKYPPDELIRNIIIKLTSGAQDFLKNPTRGLQKRYQFIREIG